MDNSGELVRRARDGDAQAIERLLERHLPHLRAYVRLRMAADVRAKESASDLVQSTCRDVLEHLDRFQYGDESGFRHWLFRTAFRKIQKRGAYYRRARRDVGKEVAGDEALAACYRTFSTASRRLMQQEQLDQLESAMEELTETYREVILLSKVVGLPNREIAKTMDKSEEATKSLLRRALAHLAEVMNRPG